MSAKDQKRTSHAWFEMNEATNRGAKRITLSPWAIGWS
jgi:hypothetical protein